MTAGLSLLMAGSLLLRSHNSYAVVIGGPDIISAPTNVTDSGPVNDHQQAFDERQNVLLAVPLAVDGGFIPEGTLVSSHMIFLNTDGSVSASDAQIWTFDGHILGVMSDTGGTLEAASTAFLGALGTIYPAAFEGRGLEGDDSWVLGGLGTQIALLVTVTTEPGDWIRVITLATPVPEPSIPLLLAISVVSLAVTTGLRSRRRT